MGDCEKDLVSKTQEVEDEEEIESPSSAPACQHDPAIVEALDGEFPHHDDPAFIEALDGEFHDPAIIAALVGEFKKLDLEGENENQKEVSEEEETLSKEDKGRKFQYPLRPEEVDCSFYLRTGTCRYGSNCRFNHPPRNKEPVRSLPHSSESVKEKERGKEKDKEEYPERTGQPECKFYLKTGACKFGKACRYHHPREKTVVGPAQQFNFLGLPIRPGEKECPFYMRMGSCKYATNCRFHHPDPTDARGSDPLSEYHNGGTVPLHSAATPQPPLTSWSLPGTSNGSLPYLDASPSYVGMMVSPSQGTQQNMEWNGYQVPVSPLYQSEGSIHPPTSSVRNNSTKKADGFQHHQQQMAADEFPERPGQRECQYFMKNGDCKYRSACRFHHPKNRLQNSHVLSPMGLPLRPDQTICSHYSHYGICKYGPACKYDHPLNVGSSATPVMSASDPASTLR